VKSPSRKPARFVAPSTGMKSLTREQLQSRKEKAIRFTRDVLGDPDRADEIADESLEDYAERRKIQLTNIGKRETVVWHQNKSCYLDQIADLRDENQQLQDQLDAIAHIVSPDDDGSLDLDDDSSSGDDSEDDQDSDLD
jgi:hypothetical protein